MIELDEALLRGSYPPLVTPFQRGEVDYERYARLVEFQIAAGSHGIVVCGTTGEPSVLTPDERERLLETAVEIGAGRIPIVAATGSQSFAETQRLTAHASASGADAVLVLTPYFIRPPQRGLVAYFSELGATCDLPMLLYHIPGRAAVSVELATLEAIADAVPQFVGIKHAAPDLALVGACLSRFGPSFRVFAGLEELSLPMLALGAGGMVNAVGNVVPRRIAELSDAMRDGDLATGQRMHYELLALNEAVFWDTNPIPIKYLMHRMGLLEKNEHRLPMVPATKELEERLDRLAEDISVSDSP